MNKRNLFVFVGIDGSGKTTQAEMLLSSLRERGKRVTYIWNRWTPILLKPAIIIWKNKVVGCEAISDNKYQNIEGKKRRLLNNIFIRYLWLMLFLFDYGLQVFFKVRLPMIWSKLIISDRTFYDSIIDQEINLNDKRGVLVNRLDSWWMRLLFPKPTLVFYIDCMPEIALARKKDAPNIKYLADRRNLYLDLSKSLGWIVVDGTKTPYDIHEDIKKVIEKR